MSAKGTPTFVAVKGESGGENASGTVSNLFAWGESVCSWSQDSISGKWAVFCRCYLHVQVKPCHPDMPGGRDYGCAQVIRRINRPGPVDMGGRSLKRAFVFVHQSATQPTQDDLVGRQRALVLHKTAQKMPLQLARNDRWRGHHAGYPRTGAAGGRHQYDKGTAQRLVAKTAAVRFKNNTKTTFVLLTYNSLNGRT